MRCRKITNHKLFWKPCSSKGSVLMWESAKSTTQQHMVDLSQSMMRLSEVCDATKKDFLASISPGS